MSMCSVLLCCWKKVFGMTSAFSWQNSISLCPASFCTPKAKFSCYSRGFLTFYFCIPVPHNENDIFWGCFQKVLVGLHRTVQLQLLQLYWLGHRLGLLWYWMVCLGNKQRSFCVFEIASKYCISNSFVEHDDYSISSEGFLPTEVNIMVIWVKLTHSSPS